MEYRSSSDDGGDISWLPQKPSQDGNNRISVESNGGSKIDVIGIVPSPEANDNVRCVPDVRQFPSPGILFAKGALGEDSPLQLLRTVVYILGLHCALRGGKEQNRSRKPGCFPQIVVSFDDRGIERLMYKEHPLKKINRGGGLACRPSNKTVYLSIIKSSKMPFTFVQEVHWSFTEYQVLQ